MYRELESHDSSMETTGSSESDIMNTARAILVMGRGYNERQAFDELMDVANRHHVSIVSAARHLINAVDGTTTDVPTEWIGLVQRLRPPSLLHTRSPEDGQCRGVDP